MDCDSVDSQYRQWLQENMSWLCRNSKQIDRVRIYCGDSILNAEVDNELILFSGVEEEKYKILYSKVAEAGYSKIDTIIKALKETEQDNVAKEFLDFQNATKGKTRTSEDKPLFNVNKIKKVPTVVANKDLLDFVNNMEPLKVIVKHAVEYLDKDHSTAYKMRSNPRGYALIINNIHFNDKERNRSGAAEQDSEYVITLLQQLDYAVIVKEDVAFTEIKDILKNFKQNFLQNNVDSCIVVVMSHGGNNTIEMVDGEHINVWQDVIYKFDNQNCPQLVGKPKIFIIQACQNFEQIVPRTGYDAQLPQVSDMLVCFSTIPGFVSHRDRYLGSWYIYCLTKVFSEDAHALEITKLLQKVANGAMMSLKSEDGIKQVPTYQPIAFRDFYFNPGM